MNLLQFKQYLDEFLEQHPKGIARTRLRVYDVKEDAWLPVTFVNSTITPSCPQYASCLYLHTKESDQAIEDLRERRKENDVDKLIFDSTGRRVSLKEFSAIMASGYRTILYKYEDDRWYRWSYVRDTWEQCAELSIERTR